MSIVTGQINIPPAMHECSRDFRERRVEPSLLVITQASHKLTIKCSILLLWLQVTEFPL